MCALVTSYCTIGYTGGGGNRTPEQTRFAAQHALLRPNPRWTGDTQRH